MLSKFIGDRSGNFAMVSAASMLPLVMGVGIAIDYSSLLNTQRALQNATDSAALAIAGGGKELTSAQEHEIARTYITGNFADQFTDLKVVHRGTAVGVSAKTKAPLSFTGIFGYDASTVQAASEADIARASYEIALVLDTTGSMEGGKLAAMKDAVIGLIGTMSTTAPDKDKLKFAAVPFATFVNVGPHFAPSFDKNGRVDKKTGAPWLDLGGDSPIEQTELSKGVSRFELFNNLQVAWAGCVETRPPSKKFQHDVLDTPAKSEKESFFVPALHIDEPDTGDFTNNYIASPVNPLDESKDAMEEKLEKYGYQGLLSLSLGDDDDDDDAVNLDVWIPVEADLTGEKGPNKGCDMQPITPLTKNYQELQKKISTLVASGTTNIMEGVMWGWRVLSPAEPFSEGGDRGKNPELNKIMIVLTDGANNFGVKPNLLGSEYSSFGYLVDQRLAVGADSAAKANTLMNAKTLAACTNAKKDGIEIFTIRLEEPDKATGTMLQECASAPDHFFDAPSRTQLDDVFGAIAKKIVKVRLSS